MTFIKQLKIPPPNSLLFIQRSAKKPSWKALSVVFFGLFLTVSTFKALPVSGATERVPSELAFDHIEESTVFFKVQEETKSPLKVIKTSLYDLNYIGILRAQSGEIPYFLFSGKACENCLQDKSIYALRPSGGNPTAFVYPGKILDPKNRALVLESRAFFGQCLPTKKRDIYIVYQKERIDKKAHLQSSVFIAEPLGGYLHENLMERHLPRIDSTLRLVRKKACHEIEGRNRMMLSKPIDLAPAPGNAIKKGESAKN